MPRPKTFDESQVLTQIMTVFWQQGYEATSMRDIESASGLTAGSIYHEFGNKKRLFQRTLSFYIDSVIQHRIDRYLDNQADPTEGIRSFLITTFKGIPKPYQNLSCLLVNTAAELGQEDKELGKVINQGFIRIEKAFGKALNDASNNGQVASDINIPLVARSLGLLMPGLLIASKNSAKPKQLEEVVDFHINQLLH